MQQREFAEVHCDATKQSQAAVEERLMWLDDPRGFIPGSFHSPVEKVENPFDLENLRYREPVFDEKKKKQILTTPQLVKDFVARINELPDEGKPFVIGIGTGGTPSMDNHETGGSLGTKFNFDGLMNHHKVNPQLKEEFDVLGVDLFKTDSSQLEIDDVGDMAISMSYIWEHMRPGLKERFNGFMVVHGTDTMSKSGAHLATMLGKGMPFNVVHVGAQKSINAEGTDFPRNFEDAFDTFKILRNSGFIECVTVMGRKALLTIGTNKVSGYKTEAMRSPRHKELIDFGKDLDPDKFAIRIPGVYREKDSGVPFEPVIYRGPNRVLTLHAEMSEDPSSIKAAVRFSAAKAVLIVPYQSGTFDAGDVDRIADEARRHVLITGRREHEVGPPRPHDIPIFALNEADELTDLRRYEAAESEFISAGVVPLNMTASAARAKLMRALAICDEAEADYKRQLEADVTDNFIGESSVLGMRFLDLLDPVDIDNLEHLIQQREGTMSESEIMCGGEYTEGQIQAMAVNEYRGNNLGLVTPHNRKSIMANTPLWNEILEAIDKWKKANKLLEEKYPYRAIAEPSPEELEELHRELNESLIPQLVGILTDSKNLLAYMLKSSIHFSQENMIQVRDEALYLWSHLTGNNFVLNRGPMFHMDQKYVPLVEPGEDKKIRRIDYSGRSMLEF